MNKQNIIQKFVLNDLNSILFPNQVIIMSEEKGKTLPLTLEKPKPLLELGKKQYYIIYEKIPEVWIY